MSGGKLSITRLVLTIQCTGILVLWTIVKMMVFHRVQIRFQLLFAILFAFLMGYII